MPALREDSRPLGVVYTPPEVAGPMVRLVVDRLAGGKSAVELLALRVCDPAIGAGAFVVQLVDALAEHLVAAWERDEVAAVPADRTDGRAMARAPADRTTWIAEAKRRIASTCIAGVDIDAAAVAATRAALPGLDGVRVASALELDWAAAYPEVFARGGFDLVVGNPPYIRQEQLGGKAALERFASYDGVADLYVYFVELAHAVLRPGGAYCLIVPNKWLTAAYGRPLRTYLAMQRSVDGIADLGKLPLFADADAFPCIVWGTTGRADDAGCSAPIVAVRAELGATVADVLAEATREQDGAREQGAQQARERWGAEPWHIDRPSERALLDRLDKAMPPLGEVVRERPARGVVTGCNRAFVLDRATRDRILGEEPAAAALIRPFVKGRDVGRWRITQADRWILLVDRGTSLAELPVVSAHLAQFRAALEPKPAGWSGGTWRGRKPGAYAWQELQDPVGPLVKARAARLLYQDIQTAPACALDRDGDIVPDTTVWMLPTDDRFLLAVLNSPLYAWYARRRFPPALNGAVRPKREYIRTLPIAQPRRDERRAIEEMVERRLVIGTGPGAADLDGAIASAVLDAYGLSSAERRLVTSG